MRICEVFEQVLDYDPLEHISREVQIREGFADFGVKIDGAIRLLVEAKAAATDLRERHIGQAERYAAQGNIPWVRLTNGVAWHLYHLSFGEGIEYEQAFAVDLSGEEFDKTAAMLAILHRRSIQRGELEEFWQHKTALSPESIAKALFTEEVLRMMRGEIRKREGILIDEEDLGRAIHDMLSIEARERVGPPRLGGNERRDQRSLPRPRPLRLYNIPRPRAPTQSRPKTLQRRRLPARPREAMAREWPAGGTREPKRGGRMGSKLKSSVEAYRCPCLVDQGFGSSYVVYALVEVISLWRNW
jgi:hypothetical protein